MNYDSLWEAIKDKTKSFGGLSALCDEYSNYNVTYNELAKDVEAFASALKHLGIKKGDTVAQFSENSSKWMVADQAILACGAINAVRGSIAPIAELEYIYEHSDSIALITDSLKAANSLAPMLKKTKANFLIYIGSGKIERDENVGVNILTFEEMLEMGRKMEYKKVKISPADTATLIYSSGTTGRPKGIALTHANIISQISTVPFALEIDKRMATLSVLPVWHAYERTCEYTFLATGCQINYTNVKNFKKDLQTCKPEMIIAVPRLMESVYQSIQTAISSKSALFRVVYKFFFAISLKTKAARRQLKGSCIYNQAPSVVERIKLAATYCLLRPFDIIAEKLFYSKFKKVFGGRFLKGVSGGGALAKHVDIFFEAVNINIRVGYGLTETSPVLTVRKSSDNKPHAAGFPVKNTEIKIVDAESYKPLEAGEKGLVIVRGPQVMKGYYKDAEATEKVLLPDGWFSTGDIGWLTNDGCLVLTGRLKDVIVLSNGENVEPESIEQACLENPIVNQVVLVGQDKNALGALIVLNAELAQKWAEEKNTTFNEAIKSPELKNEVLRDLQQKVKNRENFRSYERLSDIRFVDEPFTVENNMMTFTSKIKRNNVINKYENLIESML